jgi:leader peptidase (prepilin peptidase) / N-methyltransferase
MPRKRRFRIHWPYLSALALLVGVVASYILLGAWWSTRTAVGASAPHAWNLALVARSLDATVALWFLAVGASIGSFLNVVVYRLPLGRSVSGHSSCPYCRVPIASADNIPVFAWIRLRGRCRTCRLPISVQYPAVELLLGLVFLWIYFSEFARGGRNLPGVAFASGAGLLWSQITEESIIRTLLFAWAVSCLVAAGLMVARGARVALAIFLWTLLAILVGSLYQPAVVVIPWQPQPREISWFELRLDAIMTLLCGVAAGVFLGRMTAPLVYGEIDRRLLSSDRATSRAKGWVGTTAILGGLLGWQAVFGVVNVVLLVALGAGLAGYVWNARRHGPAWLADPIVWSWLGLLIFRVTWRRLDQIAGWFDHWPLLGLALLGAAVAAALATVVRRVHPPLLQPELAPEEPSAGQDGGIEPGRQSGGEQRSGPASDPR